MRDWALVEGRTRVPTRDSWKELVLQALRIPETKDRASPHEHFGSNSGLCGPSLSNWEINRLSPVYPSTWENASLHS